MTPKEKAKELIDKFYQTTPNESFYNPPIGSITSAKYTSYGQAIQCALISAEEIIESIKECADKDIINIHLIYWRKVKDEILKISKQ